MAKIRSDPERSEKLKEYPRWLMKRAHEELQRNTDCNAIFATVQARLRQEMPYQPLVDGPYMDYLGRLGTATVSDPEFQAIKSQFMSAMLPILAREWREKNPAPPKAEVERLRRKELASKRTPYRNPQAKLNESDVLAIRERSADGESNSSLARAYGVTQSAVSNILTRKTWKSVGPHDRARDASYARDRRARLRRSGSPVGNADAP